MSKLNLKIDAGSKSIIEQPLWIEDFSQHLPYPIHGNRKLGLFTEIDGQKIMTVGVTPAYHPTSNADIWNPINEALEKVGGNWSTRVKKNDGVSFGLEVINHDESLAIKKDDLIFPRIYVTNSYNAEESWMAQIGYFRMICSNGLIALEDGERSFKVKASHSAKNLELADRFAEEVDYFITNKKVIAERYKPLMEQVPKKDLRDEVINVLSKSNLISIPKGKKDREEKLNSNEWVNRVLNTISSEMSELKYKSANKFLIYNAVNKNLWDNEFNSRNERNRRQTDEKVLAILQ